MKKFIYVLFVSLLVSVSINAQTSPTTAQDTKTTAEAKPKKQSFRATKEQVMQVQKMLKVAETGKRDGETKVAIKKYQTENGLKSNGTLNRATLEKMGIELTDKQKEIPVSPSSFASAKPAESSDSSKPKKVIFRASKDYLINI
ncbi:MAG: peptidoglycan-binding protein [Acidobacteriota bacterium]|nr:peptidoglycan-binding protein [Acidobacteriota bacterium]